MASPENRQAQEGFSSLEWQKRLCVLEELFFLSPGGAHAPTHSQGGSDPISVEDLATTSTDITTFLRPDGLGGLVFASHIPAVHASTHEIGGSDPITLEDITTPEGNTQLVLKPDGFGGSLYGVLPLHGSTHAAGGTDALFVEGLATASVNTFAALRPDGLGGLVFSALAHSDLTGVGINDHHNRDHASSHSNGGIDEITVENLGTVITDTTLALVPDGIGGVTFGASLPAAHATTHEAGGSDEVMVDELATAVVDTSLILRPDGAGGSFFGTVPAHSPVIPYSVTPDVIIMTGTAALYHDPVIEDGVNITIEDGAELFVV